MSASELPEYRLPPPSDMLLKHALRILDDAGRRYGRSFEWTFGGGTVLALRHAHRFSKDIDIFLPDPQYLGYLNPRLSDVAGEYTEDYEEASEFIKLRYVQGEVDFVAGGCLSTPGAELARVDGREMHLETDIEIVAKKLHYRGASTKARDLFDLSLVLEVSPNAAKILQPWARLNRTAMLERLSARRSALAEDFNAIDRRNYSPAFEEVVQRVEHFLLGC